MRIIQTIIAMGFWLLAAHAWPQSSITPNAGNPADPRIILSNPAAPAVYQTLRFVSGYNRYYFGLAGDELNNGVLGIGLPLGAAGNIGLSGDFFNAQIFSRQKLAADYAKPLWEGKLAAGARLSYVRLSYDKSKFHRFDANDPLFRNGNTAEALSFSVGLLATPVEQVSIGLVFDDLNRPNLSLAGDAKWKTPISANGGAMISLPFARMLFSVEHAANALYLSAGVEKPLWNERVLLRSVAAQEQLGFGAAYSFGRFRLDYDFAWPLSDLKQESSGSHYFTLSYIHGEPDFSIEFLPPGEIADTARPDVFPCDTLICALKVRPLRGFTKPVQLSVAGMAPDISAEIIPSSVMPKQTATLKVIVHSDSKEGDARFAVQGRADNMVRSAEARVRIKHRPPLNAAVKSAIDTATVSETHHVSEETPLLNYIFFAEDGAEIRPDRYNLRPDAKIRDDASMAIIEQYRNVLNIFARRLKDNRALKVVSIGCNANYDNEKGNLTLSRQRAQNVRRHLVEACGVDSAQIAIQPHNLPDNPSTCNDPLCREENRRVEIVPQPGSETLLAPLKTTATEATLSDSICTFTFSVANPEAAAKRWELTICDERGEEVRKIAGTGVLPGAWAWNWRNNDGEPVSFGQAFQYRLIVEGECGRRVSTDWQSIFVKHLQQEAYRTTERTRLFLFQFDSDSMDVNAPHLRLRLDRIVERFYANQGATILIVGHTDTIGTEAHNKQLAIKRAKTIYDALIKRGLPPSALSYQGFGSEKPIARNGLPEGRMMNRRVEVDVIYSE